MDVRQRRNVSLHGLRGCAVLLVLAMHSLQMGAKVGLVTLPDTPWMQHAIERVGPLGVVLFFMISGYLIVDSLQRHGDVLAFARSRALRLYPVFVPLHLVMFTVGPVIGYEWMGGLFGRPVEYVQRFAENLFFVPGMVELPIAQKNAWSLSYELVWYALAALLFVGLARRAGGSGGNPAGSPGGSPAGSPALTATGTGLVVVTVLALLVVSVLRVFFAWFLVGALVHRLVTTRGDALAARRGWGAVVGVAAPLTAALFMFLPAHWAGLALLPSLPLFLGIVLQAGAPARLLGLRGLQYLGTISYTFYLVHPFVLEVERRIVAKATVGWPGPWPFLIFVVLGVASAIVVSGWVHRLLEVRFTRWLEARIPRPQRRPDVAQSSDVTVG